MFGAEHFCNFLLEARRRKKRPRQDCETENRCVRQNLDSDGWEEFAVAHNLRVGDITVFRHEGELVFHVTVFGTKLLRDSVYIISQHQ